MNTNQQFRVFTARTAITLLVVLFANVTAWAQGILREYVIYTITDPDNLEACASVVEQKDRASVTIHDQVTIGGKNYTVTSIGDGAFAGCASLKDVIMEGSVPPSLGTGLFEGCDKLRNIIVPKEAYDSYVQAWWDSGYLDLVKFDNGSGLICYCGYCGGEDGGKNLIWRLTDESENGEDPDGIRETLTISGSGHMELYSPIPIDEYSNPFLAPWYNHRENINNVNIGNGVTSIGNYAFYDCCEIGAITIPSAVSEIGEKAFYSCPNLTTVFMQNGYAPMLGADAFSQDVSIIVPMGAGYGYCNADEMLGWSGYTSQICYDNGVSVMCGPHLTWYIDENDVLFINGPFIENLEDPSNSYQNADPETMYNYDTGGTDESIDYSVAAPWCDYRSTIKEICIDDRVSNIGHCAFYGCNDVQTVYLPQKLQVIGNSAFEGCILLTYIDPNPDTGNTIPATVTSIGNRAFLNCSSLQTIEIPANVTRIHEEAFMFCYALSSVKMHSEEPPTLDDHVFEDCDALKQIIVPDGAAYAYCTAVGWGSYASIIEDMYGNGAMCGDDVLWTYDSESGTLTISGTGPMCDYDAPDDDEPKVSPWYDSHSIATVVIGSGVTRVGSNAFSYCHNLSSITIPASVTSIGDKAFYGCNENAEFANLVVTVKATTPPELGGGVFENIDYCGRIVVPNGSLETYANNNYWKSLLFYLEDQNGNNALHGYCGASNVNGGENVTWSYDRPNSVLTISGTGDMDDYSRGEDKVPSYYEILRDKACVVVVDDGVTSIGKDAFADFTELNILTIGRDVKRIGDGAFNCCPWLTDVVFPDGLTTIGANAFSYAFVGDEYCDFVPLTIPATVTSIGACAFLGTNLKEIVVEARTPPESDEGIFADCNQLSSITVPYSTLVAYKTVWSSYAKKIVPSEVPTNMFDTSGSENDPYVINTIDQLDFVTHCVNNRLGDYAKATSYYRLGADLKYTYLDDDVPNFTAIGTLDNPFEGHFDGDGHTISGIRIFMGGKSTSTDNNQGLFACIGSTVGSSAEVKDVTLDDCRITGYKNVGGIAGRNKGTITGCRVTNTVTINAVSSNANNHGGIAGSNTGTIQNCISSANVISDPDLNILRYYGGIVGNNGSYILKGNKVLGAIVTSTSNGTHGAIAGNGNDGGTYQNNLYSNCTVGEETNNIGIGNYIIKGSSIGATDIVKNNGARHVDRGDANADGSVSVTDIAVVVNEILQISNTIISFYGADANDDLNVTVTDIGVIVDMILGNSGGNASARRMTDEGPEPQ